MANLSVSEVAFAASIALYHQCCAALSCIATTVLHDNLYCAAEMLPLACVSLKQYRFLVTFEELFHIRETSLKTPEVFQVKAGLCPESKFALHNGNANLILIWSNSHFQYSTTWVCRYAKNTGVDVLKTCYRFTIIEFVCSSRNGIGSPEKFVIDILSSSLFAFWVTFRITVLELLNLPSCNMFVIEVPVENK